MIRGTVIHGDGVGKSTGYPTANIALTDATHPDGVYAGEVTLRDTQYPAAVVIQQKLGRAEVYLFEYGGEDFYGEEISIDVKERVSGIKLVRGQELHQKIEEDIAKITKILHQ